MAAPAIQALGAIAIPSDSDECITVTLNLADALSVGHSMRAIVHSTKMPDDTKAIYMRVGTQLVSAARAEMATRIATAAASAAASAAAMKAGAK